MNDMAPRGLVGYIPGPLVVTIGEVLEAACRDAGCKMVVDATHPSSLVTLDGKVRHEIDAVATFTILIPKGGEHIRDRIAITLGDERCSWAYVPDDMDGLALALGAARKMWTDEVATIDDVAEPGPVQAYKSGFYDLDEHGFRIVLPAFMPIIGHYGAGKSILLRQLLINLWRLHGWKFLLTSFEERVKPRYIRDLRRHLIGVPVENWTDQDVEIADGQLRQCAVFLRRKRNTVLDLERLMDRIEFAVRVHGVRVVAIDPVNEIDHQIPKHENKTDYMGRFIMRLKALADDYDLLMICCAHPPKESTEKRLARGGILTLNDAADTAHYGNKADIGFCMWRRPDAPTYLNGDKLKDHETMGKPFLAELLYDTRLNGFTVARMGYDMLLGSTTT